MHSKYVAFIVPAFLIFLGIEYFIATRKKRSDFFEFESSIANISIGIAERLLNLFIAASFYGLFEFVYEHFALFNIPDHWITWVVLILATDLVWYWYHRFGHEINVMWGAHIVHHHSEEFNYTTSVRVTTIQAFARNAFWCILPLMGFKPAMVIVMLVVHGTYSFFTHTRLVKKLGWLEHVLITPSHHRVHHASNEKYLNKNYGDLFVFWDKLFGTFQKEEEEPVYGLTHPLKSHSFLWQHFHYYAEMAEAWRRSHGIKNKLKVLFGKPEMLDQDLRGELEKKFLAPKVSGNITWRFRSYLIVQLLACLTGVFILSWFYIQMPAIEKWFSAILILITLINCGALLEQRRWIYYQEYVRLLTVSAYISYHMGNPGGFILTLAFVWLVAPAPIAKKWYMRFVYDI